MQRKAREFAEKESGKCSARKVSSKKSKKRIIKNRTGCIADPCAGLLLNTYNFR